MNKLFRYNEFVVENVQAAKALLKKLGKTTNESAYKQIVQWLGNATGYAHWFVKQHFQNGATLEELKQIIDTIKAEKTVIDKFSTPVIQLENCEKFWDEYLTQSRNTEAKATYNEFPARQKRFLDLSNSEDIQMLKDLSNDVDKKTFLKKLASFTNRATLIQNLKNFLYQQTSKVNIIFLKFLIEKYLEKHERKDTTDKIQIVSKSQISFNKKVLASLDFEVDSSGKKTYQGFEFNTIDFMVYLNDLSMPSVSPTSNYGAIEEVSFVQHLLMNQLIEKFLKEWKKEILKDRRKIYRMSGR